jgi:NTP pyrophosphatase (non-canonical NTP hydrolase)
MELSIKNSNSNNQNSLNYYKTMTKELCYYKGWQKAKVEQVWLFFTEEVGELAGSIRRGTHQFNDGKRTKIEDEMGDVFSYLFQLSYMMNIDLDHMWEKNQIKAYAKNYIPHYTKYQALDNKTSTSDDFQIK